MSKSVTNIGTKKLTGKPESEKLPRIERTTIFFLNPLSVGNGFSYKCFDVT